MRRYDARDITEHHYRALRLLIQFDQAEAHITVRSKRAWPPRLILPRYQQSTIITGDAIN